jgi:hypothetical protein
VGCRQWLVLSKRHSPEFINDSFCEDCGHSTPPKYHPKYARVYIITLDCCGHMSCTCGYVQEYLAPCIHIMRVLNKIENLVPSLFHIRWWKQYNYYFGSKIANESRLEKMHKCMKDLANEISQQSYDENGKFRGCFIGNCKFAKSIDSLEVDTVSDVYKLMMRIKKYTVEAGCLEIGSDDYYAVIMGTEYTIKKVSCADDKDDEVEDACSGMELTGTASMGNGSQSFGFLSQNSEYLENMVRETNNRAIVKNDDELFHKFRSLIGSVRTYEQYQRLDKLLNEEHGRNIAENNPSYVLPLSQRGTLMFGSDESGKIETGKRRKYVYEKNK